MDSSVETKSFKSVDSVGKEAIDSIVDDGFFTYGWLKTLETSKPPINLDPFYVAAYDKDNLAAFTPCFRDVAGQYFQYGPNVFPFMKKALKISNRLHIGQEHVCFATRLGVFAQKSFLASRLIRGFRLVNYLNELIVFVRRRRYCSALFCLFRSLINV